LDTSPHKSDFVNVNGIRLHYLDWGGNGPVLLFLAGMGCNAHIFDQFAPRFTDHFHVLALSRRGHGESDHPETGYDIEMLTEDIRCFLETLKISRVILAGHSLAGVELSHFAALYPEQALGLIYLDAAFYRNSIEFKSMHEKNPMRMIQIPGLNDDYYSTQDYFAHLKKVYPSLAEIWGSVIEEQGLHEIMIESDGRVVDRMSSVIESALNAMLTSYDPEDAKIQAPTLSFFAFPDATSFISQEYMSEAQQKQVIQFFETTRHIWIQQSIEQFRHNVPHAKIVEIPHGHHYCFIKNEELVFSEMRRFLVSSFRPRLEHF
jgi:non-heme chloroperoxidase